MIGGSKISFTSRMSMKTPGLNMVPLMDVFTILVFYLLVSTASNDVSEPPKTIKLPTSYVEIKPRDTVSVVVTEEIIMVQGEYAIDTPDILTIGETSVPAIVERLNELRSRLIGISDKAIQDSAEVTLLADRDVQFEILNKVMSSCSVAGFEKISLAVVQKPSQDR